MIRTLKLPPLPNRSEIDPALAEAATGLATGTGAGWRKVGLGAGARGAGTGLEAVENRELEPPTAEATTVEI